MKNRPFTQSPLVPVAEHCPLVRAALRAQIPGGESILYSFYELMGEAELCAEIKRHNTQDGEELYLVSPLCRSLHLGHNFCKKHCGVLSPLEFLHEKPVFSYQSYKDSDAEQFRLMVDAQRDWDGFSPAFSEACTELAIQSGTDPAFAAVFILSALATICQDKIHISMEGDEKVAFRFFPVTLPGRTIGATDLRILLTLAFAPVMAAQDALQEEGREQYAKIQQQIAKIKRGLNISLMAGKPDRQLADELRKLKNTPRPARFIIEKWSPAKLFEQVRSHPEACCILDSDGAFLRSLRKNTRATNDKIRFMANSDAAARFRVENEFGQRKEMKNRGMILASISSIEDVRILLTRRNGMQKGFNQLLLPVEENTILPVRPMSGSRGSYQARMNELLGVLKDAPPLEINLAPFVSRELHKRNGAISRDAAIHHCLLAVLVEAMLFFYEHCSFRLGRFTGIGQFFAHTMADARSKLTRRTANSPEDRIAERIKRRLAKTGQVYFRLRDMQVALSSVKNKAEVQAGIDRMIYNREAAEVFPRYKIPDQPHAGQLYMLNVNKVQMENEPQQPYVSVLLDKRF